MLRHHRGFTLIEVMIVSGLTAFLAVLLSSAWMGISKSTVDLVGRGRLIQELDMTVASLSRDLGGSLAIKSYYPYDPPNVPGELGGEDRGVWIGCRKQIDALQLCYDGSDGTDPPNGVADWAPPDTVIEYRLEPYVGPRDEESNVLVRQENPDALGEKFVVAKNVDGMVIDITDGVLTLELTFKYHSANGDYTRKCTLKARIPQ
jgi:prepilin-type N-terminal cleavage/methylation domain-containing protein